VPSFKIDDNVNRQFASHQQLKQNVLCFQIIMKPWWLNC